MKVRYSYLPEQFADCEDLWEELKEFVSTGDFTLGKPLEEFEEEFAGLIGASHAIGVNSGTDAIKLSLRAAGVGRGDEVITAANTFVATVGAIAELGARPVFVDCNDVFCMDVALVESAITEKTKAIVPVHFTGYMTDMVSLGVIAEEHKLVVIEDACQSILASQNGRNAGIWGKAGAFSLHPLKNLNVWSDGGVIVTDDAEMANQLRLLRNHGLKDRDTVVTMGYNSRLDTIQAIVGKWLLPKAFEISQKRISNAKYYDRFFQKIPQITIPPRDSNCREVYHLYVLHAERRNELLKFCCGKGVEAKVHYPVPIYRQPGLAHLGHSEGDFPKADAQARSVISFPCDQHLSESQLNRVIDVVNEFYT